MQTNTEPTRFQCRHIFTDGRRCGSPSLRNENFCYYHGKTRRPGPRPPELQTIIDPKNSTFELPSPADLAERSGIQHAIGLILHKIAQNEIDPRRAGLILYGLQIASRNLPREKSAPRAADPEELVEEIVHDPEVGPLAPEADWEDNRPKGTIERLIEQLEALDDYSAKAPTPATPAQPLAQTPAQPPIPADLYPLTLSAAAVSHAPRPHRRSRSKFNLSGTFAQKYGVPKQNESRSGSRLL